jgi:tRNA U54 and U55 pseudouridine synthase Pus10
MNSEIEKDALDILNLISKYEFSIYPYEDYDMEIDAEFTKYFQDYIDKYEHKNIPELYIIISFLKKIISLEEF